MTDIQFLECEISMPLMSLPVRSTVVTLSNAVILISPGSKLTKDDLLKAGAVTDIVAPSLLHCGGALLASQTFPHARVWGPKGAKAHKPEVPWTDELSENSWPFQNELRVFELQGAPRFSEHIFFHGKSKSLIVTDLFFNMPRPRAFVPKILMTALGTSRGFAVSRLFASVITDKEAFVKSVRNFLQEDFTTIIMSHGSPLQGGRKEALEALQARGLKI